MHLAMQKTSAWLTGTHILNVLKTIFTRCFVFWLGLVVIYASIQIFRGAEPLLSWIGLDLTALALIPFFVDHFRNKAPVHRRQTLAYSLASGFGLVICITMSYRYQQAAGIIHIWAGVTFIAWVGFVRLCLPKWVWQFDRALKWFDAKVFHL